MADLAQRYREEDLVDKPASRSTTSGSTSTSISCRSRPRPDRRRWAIVRSPRSIPATSRRCTGRSPSPVIRYSPIGCWPPPATMFSIALKTRAGEDKPWRDPALGNPCAGVERNSEEGRERFFSEAEIAAISDALHEYSGTERNHPIGQESAIAPRIASGSSC